MLKPIIAALLLTTATPAIWAATPDTESETVELTEAEKAQKELDEMMSIFNKMFDTSKLPEPEPARVELATTTASRLLPDGAFAKLMNDMMGSMLTPLLDAFPGLTDAQIVTATGASEDAVAALTDEKKAAITLIIDPSHKQRGTQTLDIVKPMITEAMAIIEPAMRTGLSRAYARKFTAPQLTTINGFFATPTGGAFARESFALMADPEVMQAMFKALPSLFNSFMRDGDKYKAQFDALPKQRELKDLSETEMQQLAGLLGVEVKSLEDYRTIATAVDPTANESGEEPWYSEDAWAATERKKVKALETKYNAASARSEMATEQSVAAYEVYEKAWQAAVDAARKRMLAEGWTPPPEPSDTTDDSADAFEAVAAL